ncbi:DegT/DnrJ/EryC1/StrS family aminotransferase [Sulfurovum sp.]|uniref:DegT/DnrJ/EryC1/StrS family aminotransferase n=1 Tax=Sulfurovum sp. TaxID=1969726 RepID=UPI00356856B1
MNNNFINVATPTVSEEEVEAVRKVLLSGHYASGPIVAEFEQNFAEYVGTKFAVAVNSGTAALHIAMEAMGVGPGDEVIVPPLTFFATVSAVLYLGAKPIFADIDKDDLCLSPKSVEDHITEKTKVILPVHLFGSPAKMDDFVHLADKYSVLLLEDCAQAHGSEFKGKKVGNIGDVGAFSFFATKHMTTGEGGIITTNDSAIAKQCKCIRSHGMSGRDDHVRLGFNNRMTEIEAAMGIVQLKKLDDLNSKRIDNSKKILEAVRRLPWAHVPVSNAIKENVHTYFWCPVMVKPESGKSIEDLKVHLNENYIGFRHRYAEPLYKQPVLKKYGHEYSDIFFKNVEEVAGNVIGLPNHPLLQQHELDKIVSVLQKF